MQAIVHHGGAGTVAAAVRSGRPQVIWPFGIDQPFWSRRMASLGVAPPARPVRALTGASFAAALDRALGDRQMATRAAELGARVRAEDGVGQAISRLEGVVAGTRLTVRTHDRAPAACPGGAAADRDPAGPCRRLRGRPDPETDNGIVVVMVSGFFGTKEDFRELLSLLAEAGFRGWAYDYSGQLGLQQGDGQLHDLRRWPTIWWRWPAPSARGSPCTCSGTAWADSWRGPRWCSSLTWRAA